MLITKYLQISPHTLGYLVRVYFTDPCSLSVTILGQREMNGCGVFMSLPGRRFKSSCVSCRISYSYLSDSGNMCLEGAPTSLGSWVTAMNRESSPAELAVWARNKLAVLHIWDLGIVPYCCKTMSWMIQNYSEIVCNFYLNEEKSFLVLSEDLPFRKHKLLMIIL